MPPEGATRREDRSDRPEAPRKVDQEGDSSGFLSMLIEPRLKQDRRGHPVDELTPPPRGNAALAQAARCFDGRPTLVDELDFPPRCIGQRLGKPAGTAGFAPFSAATIERQTHQKAVDFLRPCESNELRNEPARRPTGQRGARMRNHAELIGHGQPHAYLPEIDGRHTHPVGTTL